jgi:NAD(P)-dependent dehydrogenase (short-subunit alcohol dehydrogenase family)
MSFVSNESSALAVAADVEAVGRRALPVRADSADPEQVAQLFSAIDRKFGRDAKQSNRPNWGRDGKANDKAFKDVEWHE